MISIDGFCGKFNACENGRKWAEENYKTMYDVWETARPDWLIWVAARPGVLDCKTVRLFAIWCARQAWHLIVDERSKKAVDIGEDYAKGAASVDELTTAYKYAREASIDVSVPKKTDDESVFESMTLRRAAQCASRCCATDRDIRGSLSYISCDHISISPEIYRQTESIESREASRKYAMNKQAQWLRDNANPNFEMEG